jgi:hypothetical protein
MHKLKDAFHVQASRVLAVNKRKGKHGNMLSRNEDWAVKTWLVEISWRSLHLTFLQLILCTLFKVTAHCAQAALEEGRRAGAAQPGIASSRGNSLTLDQHRWLIYLQRGAQMLQQR